MGAAGILLRRNLLIYGFGGIFIPFIGIKLIDVLITTHRTGIGDSHEEEPRSSPS